MSRGQGWRFLEIGRTSSGPCTRSPCCNRSLVSAPVSGSMWEAVLAVAHSVKTYRRRYRSQVQPGAVLDLLLLDESNPRSVGYQLLQLQDVVAGARQRPRAATQ